MTKVGFFLATSPKVVPDSKSLETFMEKKKFLGPVSLRTFSPISNPLMILK